MIKVNIEGFEYECRSAKRSKDSIILYLGKYDESGVELTTTFINTQISDAFIVDGNWEYDEFIIPSEEEDTSAMLVDHEYRLTLLELGITEEV